MIQSDKLTVYIDSDIEDLIPGFLENRHKDVQSVLKALDKGDYEAIRYLGHIMKGAGGGYGFDTISEIGEALEQAAGHRDSRSIRRMVNQLTEYLERIEVVFQ